jgi:perosamine synthetase
MFKEEKHPVSENLSKFGFYLPSGIAIKKEQISKVVEILKKILFKK